MLVKERYYNTNICLDSLQFFSDKMLELIKDVDTLLKTNKNFLLGTLLKGTVEKAETAVDETHSFEEMKKAFLFSAKNQVTLWGPRGQINDYSSREWADLIGEYHYGRWELYFDMINACLKKGEYINLDGYHDKAVDFGVYWDNLVFTRRDFHE